MPAPRAQSPWRRLLPRSVAVLGETAALVLHWEGSFWALQPSALEGLILCADPSGRELFFLRPMRSTRRRDGSERRAQALQARELREQFTHRAADGLWNCAVPPFRKPAFVGELAIIRYLCDKAEDFGDEPEMVEWEHYFEKPGDAPAYPQLWDVGGGQFYMPAGPFRVESRGIVYAHPPRETRRGQYGEEEEDAA